MMESSVPGISPI